jgi:hypothetical protein
MNQKALMPLNSDRNYKHTYAQLGNCVYRMLVWSYKKFSTIVFKKYNHILESHEFYQGTPL